MNIKKPELILFFMLGIAAFAFWETALSFQSAQCSYQKQYKHNDTGDNQKEAAEERAEKRVKDRESGDDPVIVPLVCSISGLPTAIRIFMNRNEGFFVGTFTFLLVFVTGWLVWATIKLWEGAENTARRQLQAYVSLSPHYFGGLFNNNLRITFDVKNNGNTPAFDIHHRMSIEILDNPLPPGFKFPDPLISIDSQTTLSPGTTFESRFHRYLPEIAWKLGEIAANKQRIHCWGVTYYRDVFNIERRTIFSASAGGTDFVAGQIAFLEGETGPGWGWDYGPSHNRII